MSLGAAPLRHIASGDDSSPPKSKHGDNTATFGENQGKHFSFNLQDVEKNNSEDENDKQV